MQQTIKELLKLERICQKNGVLSPEEQLQWQRCAELVFGQPPSKPYRRTTRIPVNCYGTISFNSKNYDCQILDISLLGLSLKSNAFVNIEPITEFLLKQVFLDGNPVDTSIKCSLVRQRDSKDKGEVGVELSADLDSEKYQVFAQQIYFPLYINYLESISK